MKKFVLAAAVALSGAMLVPKVGFAKPAPLAKSPTQTKPFRIVIDAGHGGADQGSASKDILEKDVTLSLALKLREKLEQKDIQVIMTRTGDKFLSLKDRLSIVRETRPDCFISLHLWEQGKFSNPFELSYNRASGKAFSNVLGNGVRRVLPLSDANYKRAAQWRNFYVLREASVPSVMLTADPTTIAEPQTQEKLVHEIANGVLYFSKTIAAK